MSARVDFIVGRSGSGKTEAVFEAIARNERAGVRSFLIVPDRETFEVERALSIRLGKGLFNTSVLSFTRLANRVIEETGRSLAYLSAQGRRMLIRRVIDENANKLTAFKGICRHNGFAEECDRTILMFKRFDITPDQLTSASGLDKQLKAKLDDFALVYSKLIERMQKRYLDAEDRINSLIERLPESSVRGADVFIDAPDMLNEQIYRITESIFALAKNVIITLRGDGEDPGANGGLFAPDAEALSRLEQAARRCGCDVRVHYLNGNKRGAGDALKYLESALFDYYAPEYGGDASVVEICSSPDIISEVRDAAGRIVREIKDSYEQNADLRFNETAVAVCDLEAYKETIRRVFGAYGIPYFMDDKPSLASHPIAELILAALDCVEHNFRAKDFIRVMKTGLTGEKQSDIEKLENHIIRFGLNGSRIYSDEPSVKGEKASSIIGFDDIESVRKRISAPILRLKQSFDESNAPRSASSRIEALYGFLEELGVAEKVKRHSRDLEKRTDDPMNAVYAGVERQVYDKCIELLDQIYVILGEESIGLERFSSVVREGLESYEIGLIPPKLDGVLVGDLGSMHTPAIKRLIVLGALEGAFPAVRQDDSIINDHDLKTMRECGINAWDTTEKMDAAGKLSLYTLLTRPTEKLTLSYPRSVNGSPTKPARLLAALFPKHTESASTAETVDMSAKAFAFDALARGMRRLIETGEAEDITAPLYAYFIADEEYKQETERMLKLCSKGSGALSLGRDASKMLYGAGNTLRGSVSRLQQFNECPYRYLMNYGLSVREREEYELKKSTRGTIIHNVFDKIMKALAEEGNYESITRETLEERFDELIDRELENETFGMFDDSAVMRVSAEEIKQLLYETLAVVIHQINSGKFRPYELEFEFGKNAENDYEIVVKQDKKDGADDGENFTFRMNGKVDRIDLYTSASGGKLFRIIDYKSSPHSFDYGELDAGISLQLPIYAAATEKIWGKEGIRPAGMYYFGIDAPKTNDGERIKDTAIGNMKLTGPTLFDEEVIYASDSAIEGTSDYSTVIKGIRPSQKYECGFSAGELLKEKDMKKVLETAETRAKDALKSILDGEASISPYRKDANSYACQYCPYLSVCRFDTTAGSRYRRIKKKNAVKFFGHELLDKTEVPKDAQKPAKKGGKETNNEGKGDKAQ